MQRTTSSLLTVATRCILFAAIVATSGAPSAQVLDYVCDGELRTDKVFEPDGVQSRIERFRVTANIAAGYVKRDPALAAGCFAGRTEVCACEPPSAEKIVCRSLGFRADGTEVTLDFILSPGDQVLYVTGKEFNARLGALIEIHGQLVCSRSPAVTSP
ncbi:MAG: hypothetical protein RI928_1466 [Pseudomonadota bacterium]|jgi:hypothetical protein